MREPWTEWLEALSRCHAELGAPANRRARERSITMLFQATRRQLGAARIAWAGAGGAVRRCSTQEDAGEGPRAGRGFEWGIGADVNPGRLLRWSADDLRRRPGMLAHGIREVIVCGAQGARGDRGRLVCGFTSAPRLDEAELLAIARAWCDLEQLAEAANAAELDRQFCVLGRRAASVLHDMGHLLTVLTLQVERLDVAAGETLSPRQAEMREVLAAARKLRLDGRALQLGYERIRPMLAREVEAARRVAGDRRTIPVQLNCPEDLAFVTDSSRLSRIVRNLVLNALEAAAVDRVEVQAELNAAGGLELAVSDTGSGIPQTQLERLRRRDFTPRGSRGHGLASVAECVEELAGEFALDSRVGQGTRAEVRLPARSARPAILVLDVDPRRRSRLVAEFESRGGNVESAKTAYQAREIMQRVEVAALVIARGTHDFDRDAVLAGAPMRVVQIHVHAPLRESVASCADRVCSEMPPLATAP